MTLQQIKERQLKEFEKFYVYMFSLGKGSIQLKAYQDFLSQSQQELIEAVRGEIEEERKTHHNCWDDGYCIDCQKVDSYNQAIQDILNKLK